MYRYRHFDDEFDSNNANSAAILPEIEIDEPFPYELNPQLQQRSHHSLNLNKVKIIFSKRTSLERFLLLILILLIILFFILLIFSMKYYKKTSMNSFCLTSSCIEVSHILLSGMNKTIEPCDDFYQFVCGRWMHTNTIPKGFASWSTIQELSQKNTILLKNILEQTPISSVFYAEQQAMLYYQSCMNLTELDRLNLQPLENHFEKNLNLTLKQWINIEKNQTWEQLFISLMKTFSVKYTTTFILPIKISADEKNSTWNNIYIDQPQLGLGSRDYYINSSTDPQLNAKNKIIRDTYSKVGSEVLQLLGFEKNDAIKRMNDIVQFETELARICLPMEMLQKHDETYHLMSLKQLQEQYQSIGFDILSFFNNLFSNNTSDKIQLNENDQVIVLTHDLVVNVSNILKNYLLTTEKSHIIIDYFLFSFVLGISSHLPLVFQNTILPLRKELFGTDSPPERVVYCIKDTDTSFGYALGALYIDAVFGETDRSKANEIIKNIREIFGENLNELSWIDEQSKNEARQKLNNIYEKIGYPDFIRNQTKLNEYYTGAPMVDNEFFDNAIRVIYRVRRQKLNDFRQKVDRTEWRMTPRAVNAYYSESGNEIVFPAGILQPPFFHKDLPISINYGGIGSIIGHEITHGFDNQGRMFDSNGNIRSWWTNNSLENFQEKTKCFIKQYSNFSFDGQNENGQRTLDENLADNGGLKLAYFAYQKHKKQSSKNGNNLRLPGLDYNSEQLFFISFARVWCNIATSNGMHHDLLDDPHSLARFRVTGTLQNNIEFSKAFSCKSKTLMNPSDKCQLW